MKVSSIFLLTCSLAVRNASFGQTNTLDPLIAKYDLNHNGKIDVNERKPYVHEMSRQRREEAKTFAAQQPVLSPQERMFFHPPQINPELIQKYDANHNGKLDLDERLERGQSRRLNTFWITWPTVCANLNEFSKYADLRD